MKKRILSFFAAAAVLAGSVLPVVAEEPAVLSPRAVVEYDEASRYVYGFDGIPSAAVVAAQFDGNVKIVTPKGEEITGDTAVPAESSVMSGTSEVAKVAVYGDANRDGKINLSDVTLMLKAIARWDVDISSVSADASADIRININDVSLTLKYIAKWDVRLGYTPGIRLVNDGLVRYCIMANTDDPVAIAFATAVKEACGVELPIRDDCVPESTNYIVIGSDLCDKYDFIDAEAAAKVDPDKAYIDTYAGDVHIVAEGEGVEFAAATIAGEFDGEDLTLPRGYAGPITHMTERGRLYWDAVARIEGTAPSVDGTNGMNEDIYIAISNANFTAPKNIIYMIGDGMGKNIVSATEIVYKDELYGGQMTMKYLPNIGLQSTYSSNEQITDSAAGGTALSTGHKTTNGTIAMNADNTISYKTLLEIAAEKGMSTGVIATKSVTDATPATFTAHVHDRGEEVEIARQQLTKLTDGTLDLILGGGYEYYNNSANSGVMAAAKERGVTYTNDWEMAQGASLPLAGIFYPHELPTDGLDNDPHIADMTDLALNLLSEDENGFFLMVEGSKIDSYGHANEFGMETDETFEFDCAVAVALRYVALNPDTVLIITADHETGALSIPAEPTADNIESSSRYGSSGHFWVDVPVYAIGYRTEELLGFQENTDVAIFTASLMSDEEFGYKSQSYELFDLDDEATGNAILAANKKPEFISLDGEGVTVSLSSDNRYLYLPVDKMITDDENTKNVSAVRITYRNNSDKAKTLPSFFVMGDGYSSTSVDRITYINPGETMTFTYVLESGAKNDGYFNAATEMALTMRSGSIDITILDIEVVNRPFDC